MKRSIFLTFAYTVLFLVPASAQWKAKEISIPTRWGKMVSPGNVWQEYPRPQLVREDWVNLNGLWEYALVSKSDPMPKKFQGKILVPFCIESALSGVQKTMLPSDRLWYKQTFSIPENWSGKNVILNFEAVDYSASVWLNGLWIGAHKGAYDRFSFDITGYIRKSGSQELILAVDDPTSFESQPRGKQQFPQRGIWYTPVSGIWQTVWLEAVSEEAWIKEVKLVPDIDQENISVIPLTNKPLTPGYEVRMTILKEGKEIANAKVNPDGHSVIPVDNPRLWSPDDPFLYDIKLELYTRDGKILDQVQSYFGMRKISLGDYLGAKYLFLNNEPLFHYGTLDQGWWPDGLHTPPSDEAMKYDIEMTKKMGFNMIRKHIKVEPDRWYYHCDKIGIMVWQDMPSGMAIDAREGQERPQYIQNIGPQGDDLNRRSEVAAQFEWEMRRMVDLRYNSPAIVMWIPFNEGWGQYATCRITNMLKALDPSRLVNPVSGWALHPCGDVYDIHSYHTEVLIPPICIDRASVLGEYGGIGFPVKDHLWNPGMRNWGYQTYQSEKELLENYKYKFDQIVEMKKNKGLSAAVYTQTTDVEGEVNGLMTYDREVIKMPVDSLMNMHSVLYKK